MNAGLLVGEGQSRHALSQSDRSWLVMCPWSVAPRRKEGVRCPAERLGGVRRFSYTFLSES